MLIRDAIVLSRACLCIMRFYRKGHFIWPEFSNHQNNHVKPMISSQRTSNSNGTEDVICTITSEKRDETIS
ncbi:hypothetical protein P3L10_011016 [Capsicum annuum]